MNDSLLAKFNDVERLHWWWEGRRVLIKMLLGNRKYKKILDIGCGTGETLTYLKTIYPKSDLYGVDLSGEAVKYAKKRGHKNIRKANALKLPFKNNFFDAVLFLDVLEHIKNDQGAINEAKRVVRKGGVIILTSPALSVIWSDHDTNQGHYRRYTRTMIKELAKKSLMDIDFMSYFNTLLSPPIMSIRLLSRLRSLKFLTSYDNGMNYQVAFTPTNKILKHIFINEIRMIKYVKYPIGISVAAKLIK